MKEKWTGNVIGKMHNYEITEQEIADEMGVSKAYISMILNGSKKPSGARKRVEKALNDTIQKKYKSVSENNENTPE